MRKAASLLTIIATILFFAFAMSAPVSADPNGPGNNGTVKIVNNGDDPVGADDRDNDPHVCQFHIYGFHFDKNSTGTWQIESWPPTGNGTVVAQGGWTADGTGQWAVAGPALADGHYELDAKQTGTRGGDKNKVFWVKCNAAPVPANNGAQTPPNNNAANGGQTPPNNNANNGAQTPPSNNAVNGVQTPPSNNAVNGVQTPPSNNAVNGVQTAPNANAVNGVQGLPSTSTDSGPAIPLAALGLALMAFGGALLRKGRVTR